MNKQELINRVAKQTGYSPKDVGPILSSALDAIIEAVAAGLKARLTGFGVFEQRVRQERVGVNPRTKERIKIASVCVPIFRAGGDFKEFVREGKLDRRTRPIPLPDVRTLRADRRKWLDED